MTGLLPPQGLVRCRLLNVAGNVVEIQVDGRTETISAIAGNQCTPGSNGLAAIEYDKKGKPIRAIAFDQSAARPAGPPIVTEHFRKQPKPKRKQSGLIAIAYLERIEFETGVGGQSGVLRLWIGGTDLPPRQVVDLEPFILGDDYRRYSAFFTPISGGGVVCELVTHTPRSNPSDGWTVNARALGVGWQTPQTESWKTPYMESIPDTNNETGGVQSSLPLPGEGTCGNEACAFKAYSPSSRMFAINAGVMITAREDEELHQLYQLAFNQDGGKLYSPKFPDPTTEEGLLGSVANAPYIDALVSSVDIPENLCCDAVDEVSYGPLDSLSPVQQRTVISPINLPDDWNTRDEFSLGSGDQTTLVRRFVLLAVIPLIP